MENHQHRSSLLQAGATPDISKYLQSTAPHLYGVVCHLELAGAPLFSLCRVLVSIALPAENKLVSRLIRQLKYRYQQTSSNSWHIKDPFQATLSLNRLTAKPEIQV